ncbi:MAG TPA: polymer-forming cytoskeletal protein [Terriglobia bacterium]|nr:polymer-forming cytoskeletal protein [Terriglobia bacterium]
MKIWRGSKEQQIAAFFDQGTSLTGELQFSGVVRIDGNFHGSINGGETLIVGSNAVIHADIRVREIEIHGQVFGNIEVAGRAEIHSSGTFRGDLHSPLLVIHPGGVLDGHSHMIAESPVSADQFRESTQIAQEESDNKRRRQDKRTGPQ